MITIRKGRVSRYRQYWQKLVLEGTVVIPSNEPEAEKKRVRCLLNQHAYFMHSKFDITVGTDSLTVTHLEDRDEHGLSGLEGKYGLERELAHDRALHRIFADL